MIRRIFGPTAAACVAAALAMAAAPGTARGEPVLPDFSAATFEPGAAIDNPYFPLAPNTRYRYTGLRMKASVPARKSSSRRGLSDGGISTMGAPPVSRDPSLRIGMTTGYVSPRCR